MIAKTITKSCRETNHRRLNHCTFAFVNVKVQRHRERRVSRSTLLATSVFCAFAAISTESSSAQAQVNFRLPGVGLTSFTFNNTTLLSYRRTNFDSDHNDDELLSLTERFDSQFTAPPWRLQVRLDGFAPLLLPRTVCAVATVNGVCPAGMSMQIPAKFCSGEGAMNANCLSSQLHWDFRLERVALSYTGEQFSFDVGDFYAAFGRGIVLSLRKVDPLGTDTTIRGAQMTAELERFTIRALGGYLNPQNLDPLTFVTNHDYGDAIALGAQGARAAPDILGGVDRIAGGDIAARLGENNEVELGLSAVRVQFPDAMQRERFVDVIGYRMTLPSLLDGALTLYGEVAGLRRTTFNYASGPEPNTRGAKTGTATEFGRALYFTAQLNTGNLSALLEFKDYVNFMLSPTGGGADLRRIYNNAPPLEREDVQFRSNSNTRGALARVEYAFRPAPWVGGITLAGNGFTEDNAGDPWAPSGFGVAHGYLSLRRNIDSADYEGAGVGASWQLAANLGYRREFLGNRRGAGCTSGVATDGCRDAGALDWQVIHGDVDVSYPLAPNHSLEVKLEARVETRWDDFLINGAATVAGYYTFFRGGVNATYSYQDRLQISALFRVDNTNASKFVPGSVVVDNEIPPFLFPGAEVRWMFSPGNSVRIFGGMTAGGRLCAGGVCRNVPPFQGALGELILRI